MPEQKPSNSHLFRDFVLTVVVLGLAAWGIVSRMEASAALREKTEENAVPIVAVMKVANGPASEDLVLPASLQAWHEASIYARTSGYIKEWKTDIGAHVKESDLLAEIETPEIDAETHQAEADLAMAEANNKLAQSTAERWTGLLKTNSVSKQDADQRTSDAAAKQAAVMSAKANLDHLKQLEDFKHVIAPFDGIITARNVDNGALINAGSSGTGPEMFHIAEIDKLRAYVQVPEYDAPYVKSDMTAELHVVEHPDKTFTAALVHTADAIDPTSRTLLAEFEIDNSSADLLPGSYGEVHIKLPSNDKAVHLPVNALLFRSEGMQVATVDGKGNAALKSITIGRDYGKEVEVVSGLAPGETVIVNPPDSIANGQAVKIAVPKDDKKDDKKQ